MATTEVADFDLNEDADSFSKWMKEMREADGRSYNVAVIASTSWSPTTLTITGMLRKVTPSVRH